MQSKQSIEIFFKYLGRVEAASPPRGTKWDPFQSFVKCGSPEDSDDGVHGKLHIGLCFNTGLPNSSPGAWCRSWWASMKPMTSVLYLVHGWALYSIRTKGSSAPLTSEGCSEGWRECAHLLCLWVKVFSTDLNSSMHSFIEVPIYPFMLFTFII